jgi:hypothetical protein
MDEISWKSSSIPHGVLPPHDEQQLIRLKSRLTCFSIVSIIFLPLAYIIFPILSLVITCESHQKRMKRIRSKRIFCAEPPIFWTIMHVILAITLIAIIYLVMLSFSNGRILYIIMLAIFSICYLLHAYYFRSFL